MGDIVQAQKENYREIAIRHGDKWLKSRETGIRQHLRYGKGNAAELEEKLSILLEVMGQREKLAGKLEGQMATELQKIRRCGLDGTAPVKKDFWMRLLEG
jgi:hypothetical protein